jgi:hypothetical protein
MHIGNLEQRVKEIRLARIVLAAANELLNVARKTEAMSRHCIAEDADLSLDEVDALLDLIVVEPPTGMAKLVGRSAWIRIKEAQAEVSLIRTIGYPPNHPALKRVS